MVSRDTLLAMQLLTLELKLDVFIHEFERRYNPAEPRVPVGSLDGRQWTIGAGAVYSVHGPNRRKAPLGSPT